MVACAKQLKRRQTAREFRSIVLLILTLFFNVDTFGQTHPNIEPYLKSYNYKYEEILTGKGMSSSSTNWEFSEEIDFENLKLNLKYLDPKGNTALLFYAYTDSIKKLNCWLIDYEGIKYFSTVSVNKSHLQNLEIANLTDIDRQSSFSEERGELFSQLEDSIHISNANTKLSDILFSGNLEDSLLNYETLLINPILNLGTIPWYSLRPFKAGNVFAVDYWNIQILESLNHLSIARFFQFKENWSYHNMTVFRENISDFENTSPESDSIFYKFQVRNPIVIGDPKYSKECRLNQLSGAFTEAKYVADKLDCRMLTGNEANLENFTTSWESIDGRDQYDFNSNFIYIASHGYSSSDNPMLESCLYLSENATDLTIEKCNKLTAEEIIKIRKHPMSLIVLSACETGKGKVIEGGIVGLSRCFLLNRVKVKDKYNYPSMNYYGAQNVIMSLWNIKDNATKNLMKLFTDELGKPNNNFPVSPLRKAILEYRITDPNPKNWSAFQCMGLMFPNNWYVHIPMN